MFDEDPEDEICDECGCSNNAFYPECKCSAVYCPANCLSAD